MNTMNDRVETAVRNIMSGDNTCGTLATAAYNGDHEYFRRAIRPIVDAYDGEIAALRQQRDAALADATDKRFALEAVVANLAIPDGVIMDILRKALPGHPNLKGA